MVRRLLAAFAMVAVASWALPAVGHAAYRINERIPLAGAAVDLAVGPDGSLYASESTPGCGLDPCPGPGRIERFSPSGMRLAVWGTPGSGPGQFDAPGGVAVSPSGNVYLIDRGNSRVEIFDPAGGFISAFGSHGNDPGQFSIPVDIAIGPGGSVYVTDSPDQGYGFYFPRVQKFDSQGNYLTSWDLSRNLHYIAGPIAASPTGEVFTSLPSYGGVSAFSPDGTLLHSWGGQGWSDLATDPLGFLYGSYSYDSPPHGAPDDRIDVFTPEGRKLGSFGCFDQIAGAGPLAVANDFSVWLEVGSTYQGQLLRLVDSGPSRSACVLGVVRIKQPYSEGPQRLPGVKVRITCECSATVRGSFRVGAVRIPLSPTVVRRPGGIREPDLITVPNQLAARRLATVLRRRSGSVRVVIAGANAAGDTERKVLEGDVPQL